MINLTKLPVLATPTKFQWHLSRGLVGLEKSRKPLTLLKFLIKKFQVTKDNSNQAERLLIVLSIEKLTVLMRDPSFARQHFEEYYSIEYLVDMFLKGQIRRPDLVNWSHYDKFLPSEEATYGYLNQLAKQEGCGFRKFSPPRVRKPKAARYIGVGYKDKGHLRISSYDGSPSWQEVASGIPPSVTFGFWIYILRQSVFQRFRPSDGKLVGRLQMEV